MYEICALPGRAIGKAATLEAAFDLLDSECLKIHQAAAAGDDRPAAGQDCYRFEIRDDERTPVAWLTYRPDPAGPYQSIVSDDMRAGARQ